MALAPFILQGSTTCAAMIELVLTMLLRQQVRRYGADPPTSLAPRNNPPIDRNGAAKRRQASKP